MNTTNNVTSTSPFAAQIQQQKQLLQQNQAPANALAATGTRQSRKQQRDPNYEPIAYLNRGRLVKNVNPNTGEEEDLFITYGTGLAITPAWLTPKDYTTNAFKNSLIKTNNYSLTLYDNLIKEVGAGNSMLMTELNPEHPFYESPESNCVTQLLVVGTPDAGNVIDFGLDDMFIKFLP